MVRSFCVFCALVWLSFGGGVVAQTAPQPPIEAYGELAGFRSFSMSPSGEQLAWISRVEDRDILYVYNEKDGLKPKVDISELQGNWVWFFAEDHVIIRGYKTQRVRGYKGKVDYSGAFSYHLKTGKLRQMLRKTPELYPSQSGLGRILGQLEGSTNVLMPAWTGSSSQDSSKAVFKVNLDDGKGYVFARGNKHTLDWLLAQVGTVLAREDMNNLHNTYRIFTEKDGRTRKIFEMKDVERPPVSVLGVKSDSSALIVRASDAGDSEYYEMDFEGVMTPISFGPRDSDIENFFMDKNKVIHGVRYAGMTPSYFFFDPVINASVAGIVEQYAGASVNIIDRSTHWSTMLLNIFDSSSSGRYLLFDTQAEELKGLVSSRPDIPAEAIGEVNTIEYQARDGRTIPGVLTWPAGVPADARKNLPVIIMPHGGPRSYVGVEFNWMAQYFANRGYLVLQPNFRGSSGFGDEFKFAGNGEWGGKMQDDVTDGLKALTVGGFADPDRACIVGGSYGGYAALAGGAFTPDLYKCVVAIAPVTDLERLLVDERKDHGRSHFVLDYWKEMIGDPKADKARMKATSPLNFPEAFQAPVLLVHGKDDTVVDYRHSVRMEKALSKAGKRVELKIIKDDGHSLLDNDSRLEALQVMSDFVDAAIGEGAAAPQ